MSVGELRAAARDLGVKGRSKMASDDLFDMLFASAVNDDADRPPLFVELCAGTAVLSLRLQARHARPPVSRMGAKTGYADAILRVMGLRAGLGADRFLWCEPDAGCRLLLSAYTDRALALAAAEVIRGWKDEEPRALWDRLRAEGPPRLGGGVREVGRLMFIQQASYRRGQPESGFDDEGARGRPGAIAALLGWAPVDDMPATIHPDARTHTPADLPPGSVAYIDPPYVGTTGYQSDLPRADVLDLAHRWHDAGARVYISEAEPIEIQGWHHVDITATRKGQKRTFSRQQCEWLTCSHEPTWPA